MTRALNKIYDISRSNRWEWFVTLTFNKDVVDRYDYSAVTKKLSKWLNNLKSRCAGDMKYIIVPERHKDGAFHFHGLFAECGGLQIIYSGHNDKKGNPIYNFDNYKLGFSTATKVQTNEAVTKYITKYTTKDLMEHTKGKRKYWCSKNVERPKENVLLLDSMDRHVLHDECSAESVYSKDIGFEVGVESRFITYFELKES